MPTGLVKTAKDEEIWNKAKELVHKQYPKLTEKDKRFWKLVVSIFLKMRRGND